jgi:predicted kinase
MEIVVLVGIPGSGKSTLARSKYPHHRRANLDTLRSRSKEDQEISNALMNGQDIIIDNTNTTKKSRRKYIEIASALGVKVRAVYLRCPLEVGLARNSKRTGRERVPDKVVVMYHRMLQEPTLDEGFDSIEMIDASKL